MAVERALTLFLIDISPGSRLIGVRIATDGTGEIE
jgi:hypothetical protein